LQCSVCFWCCAQVHQRQCLRPEEELRRLQSSERHGASWRLACVT
jgi:hypothetical protein